MLLESFIRYNMRKEKEKEIQSPMKASHDLPHSISHNLHTISTQWPYDASFKAESWATGKITTKPQAPEDGVQRKQKEEKQKQKPSTQNKPAKQNSKTEEEI